MSSRLLLVEDDHEIGTYVAQGLREEGLHVTLADNGDDGWRELETSIWDLLILDWWLPGKDGLTLLKKFREKTRLVPVIFLTARDAIAQRVEALNAGADDYLCKPFAFEELLARVQAHLRRRTPLEETVCTFGDIVLDLTTNRAARAGQTLELTSLEQSLLQYFLRFPKEVLSRARLYEHVWQQPYDGLTNTLDVHVGELRRKLEALGPRVIRTIRGRGYMLDHLIKGES
jgi:two-component system copper resistance phosphate regulon response regulator CusR